MGGGGALLGLCGSATTINNGLIVTEVIVKPVPDQQVVRRMSGGVMFFRTPARRPIRTISRNRSSHARMRPLGSGDGAGACEVGAVEIAGGRPAFTDAIEFAAQ
jgi:hypothetical protein